MQENVGHDEVQWSDHCSPRQWNKYIFMYYYFADGCQQSTWYAVSQIRCVDIAVNYVVANIQNT